MIVTAQGTTWWPALGTDRDAQRLMARHYSWRRYSDRRVRRRFVGPGEYTVLINAESTAVFVWRKFIDRCELGGGVNCAAFRNEGGRLSSDLIAEADEFAWRKWPGERLYTYVDASKIRSTNPGYCFLKAGWRRCGYTKDRGLHVLEILPGMVREAA